MRAKLVVLNKFGKSSALIKLRALVLAHFGKAIIFVQHPLLSAPSSISAKITATSVWHSTQQQTSANLPEQSRYNTRLS